MPPGPYAKLNALIENFKPGLDADKDGYYETFDFDIGINAHGYSALIFGLPLPISVWPKIICNTTKQEWWSGGAWTINGLDVYHLTVYHWNQDAFKGRIETNTDLDFTVELWNNTKSVRLDQATTVKGEPVKAGVPAAVRIASITPGDVTTNDWGDSLTWTITGVDAEGKPVGNALLGVNDTLAQTFTDGASSDRTDANGQVKYTTRVPQGRANGTYPVVFTLSITGFPPSASEIRMVTVDHRVTVLGRVIDGDTLKPLDAVQVSTSADIVATTSADGDFALFDVPFASDRAIAALKEGYVPFADPLILPPGQDPVRTPDIRLYRTNCVGGLVTATPSEFNEFNVDFEFCPTARKALDLGSGAFVVVQSAKTGTSSVQFTFRFDGSRDYPDVEVQHTFLLEEHARVSKYRSRTSRSGSEDIRYTVDLRLELSWDGNRQRGEGKGHIQLSDNSLKLRDWAHAPLCFAAQVYYDPWLENLRLAKDAPKLVSELTRRLFLKAGVRIAKEIAEDLYLARTLKRLLCDDPPDPNFAEAVVVMSHSPEAIVPDSDVPLELAIAANALADNTASCRALAIALLSCIERAQGASAAGSALWERRHRRRASELSTELSAHLLAKPDLQAKYATALLKAGFQPIAVSAEAQEELKADLKTLGLPAELKSKLLALGATLEDVEAIRIQLMNQPSQSNSFPANLTVDTSAAAAEIIAAVLDDYSGSIRNTPAKLSVALDGDAIAVSWPTNGITSLLEIAPTVLGPFKEVGAQTTPVEGTWRVRLKADGAQMFLRLRGIDDN